jgi:hypothetical protein
MRMERLLEIKATEHEAILKEKARWTISLSICGGARGTKQRAERSGVSIGPGPTTS